MGVDKYESKRFWCLLLYCVLVGMLLRWKWVLVIQVQYAIDQNRITKFITWQFQNSFARLCNSFSQEGKLQTFQLFLSLVQCNDVSTTPSTFGELKVSLYMFSSRLVFRMHTYSIHIFMSKMIAACHTTYCKLEDCSMKWKRLI
jgi:hypothetical protein